MKDIIWTKFIIARHFQKKSSQKSVQLISSFITKG